MDAPAGQSGARFFTDRADLDAVTKSLREQGWSVTLSEMGYTPKDQVDLPPAQRKEVEEFLEAIDDQDDVHRIYAALATHAPPPT
jgi:transcriptional/translational regulatory protein YebC/TACO1